MAYPFKQPHPDSLLGKNSIAAVYGELATIPLYVHIRILSFKPLVGKRTSFRLSWVIEEKRWARNHELNIMPQYILDWAAPIMAETYPSVEQATGLTTEEVNEIKAEQAAKRAKYKAERAKTAV